MNILKLTFCFILALIVGCSLNRAPDVVKLDDSSVKKEIQNPFPEMSGKHSDKDQERLYNYLASQQRIADGDLDRAILDLKKVLDLDPDNSYLRRELAMYYLQAQNSAAALDLIKKNVEENPDDQQSLFLYARTLEIMNRKKEAKAVYEKLIAGESPKESVFLRLGDLYLEENDLDNAFRVYSELVKKFPDSYAGHFFIGKIYMIRGEYDKAEAHIRKTLELFPGLEEPQYELADIYRKKGQIQKSIKIFQNIIKNNPDNIFASLELAVLYHENGSAEEAQKLLDDIAVKKYNDASLYRIIGQEYLEQKRFPEAVTILEGLLKAAPEKSGIFYMLGIALSDSGKTEGAIEQFKHVDESSKFYLRAAIQTAMLYEKLGNLDAAIDQTKALLEKHRDDQDLYMFLGMFYEEKQLYKEASQTLEDGLRLDEKQVQMNFRLGIVYDKMGDRKKSIEQMKKVIQLDPSHVNALNYLGYTYADMNTHLDEAESLIRKALEYKPNDGYITDSLGWVYYKKGDFAQAVNYLEKATTLVPDDAIIREHLGDAYLKMKQTDKALEAYRRSLLLNPEDKSAIEKKINSLLEKKSQF